MTSRNNEGFWALNASRRIRDVRYEGVEVLVDIWEQNVVKTGRVIMTVRRRRFGKNCDIIFERDSPSLTKRCKSSRCYGVGYRCWWSSVGLWRPASSIILVLLRRRPHLLFAIMAQATRGLLLLYQQSTISMILIRSCMSFSVEVNSECATPNSGACYGATSRFVQFHADLYCIALLCLSLLCWP